MDWEHGTLMRRFFSSFEAEPEKILSNSVLAEGTAHAKLLWPEQDQPVKEQQEGCVLQCSEPGVGR